MKGYSAACGLKGELTKEKLEAELVSKFQGVFRPDNSTLACLTGAWTKSRRTDKAGELLPFWQGLSELKIPEEEKKLLVILVLEGDFDANGPRCRTKKMIMREIQDSLKRKLSWLNCKIMVVDSDTYKSKYFEMKH